MSEKRKLTTDVALTSEDSLAGMLLIDSSRCLTQIREYVTTEDFLFEAPREIFATACYLADDGRPADIVAILDRTQGVSREYALQAMESVASLTSASAHAMVVAREAQRRRYADALKKAELELMAGQDPAVVAAEIADISKNAVDRAVGGSVVGASEAAMELINSVEKIDEGLCPTVPCCYRALDTLLGGGLLREGLYILAARPGAGKTTLAVNMASRLCGRGKNVLFVSLEMSRMQLTARLAALEIGNLTATQILTSDYPKTPEIIDSVTSTLGRISRWDLSFNRAESLNVQRIQLCAKQCGAELVIIDYLGLISHNGGKSLYEKVTETSGQLKRMARTLNVPVLCLAQLNRNVEGRKNKPPKISDLRDSGAIEQDADGVILLHHWEIDSGGNSDKNAAPLDVILAKNRHGRTGRVEMNWYMKNGRMVERRA